MSTKFHLPAELKDLQHRLNQVPLPEGAVDRDELMYQAGWAAARQQRRWLWPTATAAMAATVLFLFITKPVALAPSATTNAPPLVATKTPQKSPEKVLKKSPPSRTTRLARLPSRQGYWRNQHATYLSLLSMDSVAMHQQPLQDLDPLPPSKTARELLQEILPELNPSNRPEESSHPFWPERLWRTFS